MLAAHRDYRLLVGAGLISLSGDWVLAIGLSYSVYVLTGSTAASGALLFVTLAPQVLLGSVAGVFADRWDHRRTMVVTNLVMAGGLLPLVLVNGADRIWLVYVVALFQASVATFFAPAESAIVPRLVGPDDLITANALNSQNKDAARLIGSAIGGVLAGTGGIAAVAVVDAASFAVSAVLLAFLRRPEVLGPAVRTRLADVWRDWREGIAAATRVSTLRVLFAVAAISSVGEGIMGTLFAPFVRDVLHSDGSVYGAIVSAQAVGGILGGLIAASIGYRFAARTLLGCGAVAFGALDLMLVLYPLIGRPVWPAFVLMVLVGFPAALLVAGPMTLFQTSTTDGQRGRIFGALAVVEGAFALVGIVLAGWLGDALGIVPVIAVQGLGYVLAGCVVLVTLHRPPSDASTTPTAMVGMVAANR